MRILVTGSSGRVGRTLVEELVDRGDEVVGLDTRPFPEQDAIQTISARLENEFAVRNAVQDVDAIIHLSALMSWSAADDHRMYDTNILGTFNILKAASQRDLHRFIFASSGEVYPQNTPQYLPIDEHHPTHPTSSYGLTKLVGEQMVEFFGRVHSLPFVILRLEHTQDARELLNPASFFSGPRFFLESRIKWERNLQNNARLAALKSLDEGEEKLLLSRGQDGTPYRMMIGETRDVVQGILLALDRPRAIGETIGIGPDAPVWFDKIVPLMAELTSLEIADVRLPGPAVNYSSSNAKAQELLGFQPEWTFTNMLSEAATAWTETTQATKR